MKTFEIKSNEKLDEVKRIGSDAIVHLNETTSIIEDSEIFSYDGCLFENAIQYPDDVLVIQAKLQLAKDYLNNTDFKEIPSYEPKEGEDLEAIKAKRKESREFIRANEAQS